MSKEQQEVPSVTFPVSSVGFSTEWEFIHSWMGIHPLEQPGKPQTPLQSVLVEKRGEKWEVAHNVTVKTKSRDQLIM